MKGKLYGIGTGPGDPELITLKAIKAMEQSDIIAIPDAGKIDRTAFNIVEKYIKDKPLIECSFFMKRNPQERENYRLKAAENILELLNDGKTVGFITLGDPTLYSTYMYVHKIITDKGFEAEIIPGITSFSAAAAAIGKPLCEGEEMLHIIPASGNENLDFILNTPGNKVIMKTHKNFTNILTLLEKKGLSDKTTVIERCTMREQKIFNSIAELKNTADIEKIGYFSLILIKE